MAILQRDREKTIRHLKKAALDVFAAHGFDKGTTKEIAKKANISEALITRYFGSKEGLLQSLIIEFVEETTKNKLPYEEQGDLEKEITLYVSRALNEIFKNSKIYRTLLTKLLTDAKAARALKDAAIKGTGEFQLRLKKLQNDGKLLKDISTELIEREITNHILSHMLFSHSIALESQESSEKASREWVRIMIRGLKP